MILNLFSFAVQNARAEFQTPPDEHTRLRSAYPHSENASKPNAGDSDSRPDGAEVLADAVLSADSNSRMD